MNNMQIRLELLLSKYEEELKTLEGKQEKSGFLGHELGYKNGEVSGEIHRLKLIIRDIKQILEGEE